MNDSDDWGDSIEEVAPSQGSNDSFKEEVPNTSGNNVALEEKNLSFKTVGVLIAVALVVIAIVLLGVRRFSINKKTNVDTNTSTNVNEQPVADISQPIGGTTLKEVPSDTVINYNGNVLENEGSIHNKVKYLLDGQVIYCLEISIGMQNTQSIHYFCGYNVYDSVSIGDVVTVSYQQVSDTCYSVNTISKY